MLDFVNRPSVHETTQGLRMWKLVKHLKTSGLSVPFHVHLTCWTINQYKLSCYTVNRHENIVYINHWNEAIVIGFLEFFNN